MILRDVIGGDCCGSVATVGQNVTAGVAWHSRAASIRTDWDRGSSVNQIVRIIKHA